MKARVNETGEVFQVLGVISNNGDGYALDEVDLYCDETDNINIKVSEDYWEKLKHQYAGMAMQGMCINPDYRDKPWDRIANDAISAATALVEKLKND